MKKLILIVAISNTFNLLAQNQDTTFITFDRTVVNEIYKLPETNRINLQSEQLLGNFISIDSKEAALMLSGNLIQKNGSSVGLRMTGGVTDGFKDLFTHTKLNPMYGVEFQYNFKPFKNSYVIYNSTYDSNNLKISKYRMNWVSMHVNLSNRAINFMDTSLHVDSMFNQQNFVSQSYGFRFNHLKLNTYTTLISIGVSYSIENHLSNLIRTTYDKKNDFGDIPNELVKNEKFSAHYGEFFKNQRYLNFTFDWFQGISKHNHSGFKFSFDYKLNAVIDPMFSMELGYLVNFKNKLHTELYTSFFDLRNFHESKYSFIQRSHLGVRLVYPLVFN